MSVTDFISAGGFGSLVDQVWGLAPGQVARQFGFPYSHATPMKAPRIGNPQRVGRAFDFLLRVYLARTFKDSLRPAYYPGPQGEWVQFPCIFANSKLTLEQWKWWRRFDARRQRYKDIKDMIRDCVSLANAEPYGRAGEPIDDAEFLKQCPEDEQDCSNLIDLINLSEFQPAASLILNPCFLSSSAIGGADADLIIDDLLVDIKTVKYLSLDIDTVRQLCLYWWLNKQDGNMYGELKRLGVYFSRFGVLYSFPVPSMRQPDKRLEEALLVYSDQLRRRYLG